MMTSANESDNTPVATEDTVVLAPAARTSATAQNPVRAALATHPEVDDHLADPDQTQIIAAVGTTSTRFVAVAVASKTQPAVKLATTAARSSRVKFSFDISNIETDESFKKPALLFLNTDQSIDESCKLAQNSLSLGGAGAGSGSGSGSGSGYSHQRSGVNVQSAVTNASRMSAFVSNTSKFLFRSRTLNSPIFAYELTINSTDDDDSNGASLCAKDKKSNRSATTIAAKDKLQASTAERHNNNHHHHHHPHIRGHHQELTSTRNEDLCDNDEAPCGGECGDNMADAPVFVHKDGGIGWLVVLAACWCFGIIIAMQNSYSLIYSSLIENHSNVTNHISYSAWIGSASNGVQFLLSVPASIVVDLMQPRKTALLGAVISTAALVMSAFVEHLQLYFFTFSFLFGIGQSLLLISTFAILPHYFNKRLGLANGLMNLGAMHVTIFVPLLTGWCLQEYGLRITWLALAALCFVSIGCALLFRTMLPAATDATATRPCHKLRKSFGVEILRKVDFLNWSFACFLGIGGSMIPLFTMTHFATLHFPGSSPVILNVIFAAFSGLSALVFGKLADYVVISRVWFHFSSFLVVGVVQLLMPHVVNFTQLMGVIATLGLCDGIYLCSLVPIVFEIAKCPKLCNQVTGYYHSIIAVPVVFGPAMAAMIFEKWQAYTLAYYIGGAMCVSCALILALNPNTLLHHFTFWKKRNLIVDSRRNQNTDDNNNELIDMHDIEVKRKYSRAIGLI